MEKLAKLWDDLRSSLWFIPALIVAACVMLAIVLIELETRDDFAFLAERFPRLFGAGASGSRGLLAAVAGSMVTVAGVTFSITIVALSLAATQYTSRILRTFMADRANQTVLGIFMGVFAYCLVVLRTIRGGDEGAFVPAIAVLVAVLLAFVAIGTFIFFIHHIASSIQASHVIQAASHETLKAIDRLFPSKMGEKPDDADVQIQSSELARLTWMAVPARKTGYVQSIDADALFEFARQEDAIVRMEVGIGEFVIEELPLVSISGNRPMTEAIDDANAAFIVSPTRTVHQDAAYGIRQIVDVALKALSPGINDTTTAINCIDFLAAICTRLADRRIESAYRFEHGKLRVIARGPTFETLMNESFDQIRQNADRNVAVLVRLLQALEILAARMNHTERLGVLRQHVERIAESAERSVESVHDRAEIRAAQQRVIRMLETKAGNTGLQAI